MENAAPAVLSSKHGKAERRGDRDIVLARSARDPVKPRPGEGVGELLHEEQLANTICGCVKNGFTAPSKIPQGFYI